MTGFESPSSFATVEEPVQATLGRRIEALLLTVFILVGSLGIGWLVWSLIEWRTGRTPSYRLLKLRVVSRSDGRPIGFTKSFVRNGIFCTVLLLPTIVVCCLLGVVFAMGASPPDQLLNLPRTAPWDRLTRTEVVDERPTSVPDDLDIPPAGGAG
jgi:RDD family